MLTITDKIDMLKLKLRTPVNKKKIIKKDKTSHREKIFVTCVTHKGFIFKTYKEFQKTITN